MRKRIANAVAVGLSIWIVGTIMTSILIAMIAKRITGVDILEKMI